MATGRFVSIALVAALSVSCASASSPRTPDGEYFAGLEQRWMDALAAKDRATLEELLASEFSIIGVGSTPQDLTTDRQSWLDVGLKRPFPKHAVSNVTVTMLGDVAVVQHVLTGDYPPQSMTAEGGNLTFLITDVWVRRAGRWQVVTRHSSLPLPPRMRRAG